MSTFVLQKTEMERKITKISCHSSKVIFTFSKLRSKRVYIKAARKCELGDIQQVSPSADFTSYKLIRAILVINIHFSLQSEGQRLCSVNAVSLLTVSLKLQPPNRKIYGRLQTKLLPTHIKIITLLTIVSRTVLQRSIYPASWIK